MTEVTRVPLQPIAKGSLAKLWRGVILAALIGAGLAWAAQPKGLSIDTVQAGTGDSPQLGDVVFVKYVGKLAATGEEFDRSQPLPIPPGIFPEGNPLLLEEDAIIPGFVEGLQKVQRGGKYVLYIPAEKGYGSEPPPGSPIPADADLEFEIEVVDFMSRADFQQRAAALQSMMGPPPGSEGQDLATPPAQ